MYFLKYSDFKDIKSL